MKRLGPLVVCALSAALPAGAQTALTLKAVNPLDIARPSQTIELSARELAPLTAAKDLRKIHVTDAAGRERLCQALDGDGDFALRVAGTDPGVGHAIGRGSVTRDVIGAQFRDGRSP